MCACARPSSQPSRALATKGGSPHRVRLNEGVRSGCVHVLVVQSCFGCVRCASAVLLPVKPVVTRWITSQRKTVCNSSLGSATVDVSGNLSKKAPTNNDGAVSDEDMRCHDPQTCTTSRHQTCYTCPSIRGGTHIRLPRAALSPLRFSAPLSHSPPRSTLLVLAGTTTFQTQPFRSTRCPRPIATPHALPRAVSTPQAVPCVALACRACSHRIIC